VLASRSDVTALNEDAPPPNMYAIQEFEDTDDYIEFAGQRFRYYWTGLKDPVNGYVVKSLEDVYFQHMGTFVDADSRYKILSIMHYTSYLLNYPGNHWYWGESGSNNTHGDYWANLQTSGNMVNNDNGQMYPFTMMRFINFGRFVDSGGIFYY
jgi:hypothetical protein